tara:strand:- start:259 stop:432 length:174 start_codon:yes stop_codon:yes gene_type:complete
MDLFNKKKVLDLQNKVKNYNGTILEMRKEIEYLKHTNAKLKEENGNLKFTLNHQRSY